MAFGLSCERYRDEPEIHDAFRDFIYKETGWKIVTCEGEYYGLTAERYRIFKAGYKRCLTTVEPDTTVVQQARSESGAG